MLRSSPFLKVRSVHSNPLTIDGLKKTEVAVHSEHLALASTGLTTSILELAITHSRRFQSEVQRCVSAEHY